MYVKYRLQDDADLKVIAIKAQRINKYIVQFSFIDINMADKFTQKCVEYLAISTVAVRHKEAEAAKVQEAIKLAQLRAARKQLLDAQRGLGRKSKY
jgi:hypothetical protein